MEHQDKKLQPLEWHTEKRRIKDLIPFEGNPRKMTEKQVDDFATENQAKQVKCEICGTFFSKRWICRTYKPRFCSSQCYGEYRKTLNISEKTRDKLREQSIKNWKNKEIRNKRIEALKGIPCSEEKKKKISEKNKKRYSSLEWRKKIAERFKGEKSHFWKGGISLKNELIRKSWEYYLWRSQVLQRDNYTCQICGIRSGNGKRVELNADHIKPFSLYPELRFEISNGRTLCVQCHHKTETFGGRILKSYSTVGKNLQEKKL